MTELSYALLLLGVLVGLGDWRKGLVFCFAAAVIANPLREQIPGEPVYFNTEFSFALLFIAVVVALTDWRKGFFVCILTALAQDALRKLVPGEPVYFTVLVGVTFIGAWIAAYAGRVPLRLGAVYGWRQNLGAPFVLLLVLIILQAVHAYARFGNPVLPAIGLLTYLAPIPAIVLGYQFAVRSGTPLLRALLWFYLIASGVALTSVYLEYLGVPLPILGEVGAGIVIYDAYSGAVLDALSGIYRSSEIAAWHAATSVCVLILLAATGKRWDLGKILWVGAAVLFLVGVGVLTGRRKMLVEVVFFLSVFLVLLAWFRRGGGRLVFAAAVGGALAYMAVLVHSPVEETLVDQLGRQTTFQFYAQRGATVFGDVGDRFANLGVAPISWAYNRFGLLGAGLGSASQGGQYFGGGAELTGGAGEGGFGKIMLELGAPGLLLVLWLGIAAGVYIWKGIRFVSWASPKDAIYSYGFAAFLAANVATFSVATQAYGDLFILLALGSVFGFLLAMPVLAQPLLLADQSDTGWAHGANGPVPATG